MRYLSRLSERLRQRDTSIERERKGGKFGSGSWVYLAGQVSMNRFVVVYTCFEQELVYTGYPPSAIHTPLVISMNLPDDDCSL